MKVKEIAHYIEKWASPGAAWEKDNVGLQIGNPNDKVTKILLALELTPASLKGAITKKCNMIITHHPLIFNPIKKLDFSHNTNAPLIQQLIKNDINLFSAHTNLDFTNGGVSFYLAETLGLQNISFLKPLEKKQSKIIVFTPSNYLEKVAEAVFNAGGGIIGNYSNCSFTSKGEGTFKCNELTNPAIGKKEELEKVDEIKLEMIIDKWNIARATKALIEAHPYEQPAFDIIPLENQSTNYGEGAIGILPKSLSKTEFLKLICKNLKTDNLLYCNGRKRTIKTVAVCGGSGSQLASTALSKDADALITADIKYHTFQDYENKLLLIDAGHYNTEVPILNLLEEKLSTFIKKRDNKIEVVKFSSTTNPIKNYNYK